MNDKIKCPECGELTDELWIRLDNRCRKCTKKKDLEFEKNYAIKHEGTSSDKFIVCPFCGSDYGIEDEYESTNCTCEECGKKFHLEVETSLTYTTSKIKEVAFDES